MFLFRAPHRVSLFWDFFFVRLTYLSTLYKWKLINRGSLIYISAFNLIAWKFKLSINHGLRTQKGSTTFTIFFSSVGVFRGLTVPFPSPADSTLINPHFHPSIRSSFGTKITWSHFNMAFFDSLFYRKKGPHRLSSSPKNKKWFSSTFHWIHLEAAPRETVSHFQRGYKKHGSE